MLPICLFVPNLIGYARIILVAVAYWYAFTQPIVFLSLYSLSFILDAADGMAARALNQCSRFGAILDMITDRAATSGFLVVLSSILGSDTALPAAGLVALDIMSHMVRMYSSLALGDESHKAHVSPFPFLNLYYGNRQVMGATCIGQEFLYLALYASHFWPNESLITYSIYGLAPLFIAKQWANVEQLIDGMVRMSDDDAAKRAKAN